MKETTYVFDFYNLYIPQNGHYVNKQEGIKIIPLRLAERFEKERKNLSGPFRYDGWKTAKCYIKTNNEKEAIKLASWLEFLYSFAQGRGIYFLKWYEYKKGKKFYRFHSKYVEPRENRFSELIFGTRIGRFRYKKDINLFISTALETLKKSREQKQKEIIITLYGYLTSRSEMSIELKFLIGWIALERLANLHYNDYKSQAGLFNTKELKKIKPALEKTIDSQLKDDIRRDFLKNSITRNFLYEHNTYYKVSKYLNSLDLGLDNKKFESILKELIGIRGKLVHDLNSKMLLNKHSYFNHLQTLLEQVIFRLLGIDKNLEKQFIINRYNMGRPILIPEKL